MSLIERFITNKLYDALYLDIILKFLWEKAIELWQIGGSARPATLVLILMIIVIALLPIFLLGFGIYKLLKYLNIIQ